MGVKDLPPVDIRKISCKRKWSPLMGNINGRDARQSGTADLEHVQLVYWNFLSEKRRACCVICSKQQAMVQTCFLIHNCFSRFSAKICTTATPGRRVSLSPLFFKNHLDRVWRFTKTLLHANGSRSFCRSLIRINLKSWSAPTWEAFLQLPPAQA